MGRGPRVTVLFGEASPDGEVAQADYGRVGARTDPRTGLRHRVGALAVETSLTNAGIHVWASSAVHDDEYSAAYQPGAAGTSSTVTVTVHGDSQTGPNGWAKTGLMLRNSMIGAGSSTGYVALAITPANGLVPQ